MSTRAISLAITALLLTGCARFTDGYQVGDATLSLADAIHHYCDESSEITQKVALRAIRAYLPFYPKDGICD